MQLAVEFYVKGVDFSSEFKFADYPGSCSYQSKTSQFKIAMATHPEMTQYHFTPARPGGKTKDGYVWEHDCKNKPYLKQLHCSSAMVKCIDFKITIDEKLRDEINQPFGAGAQEGLFILNVQMPKSFSGKLRSILKNFQGQKNIYPAYEDDLESNLLEPHNVMLLAANIKGIMEFVTQYYNHQAALWLNVYCPDLMDSPK